MMRELTSPCPASEPMLAALALPGNLSDGKHFRTKRENQEHCHGAECMTAVDATARPSASRSPPYPFPKPPAPV
jgi:hypothetical protein